MANEKSSSGHKPPLICATSIRRSKPISETPNSIHQVWRRRLTPLRVLRDSDVGNVFGSTSSFINARLDIRRGENQAPILRPLRDQRRCIALANPGTPKPVDDEIAYRH